jgi:hypothetical protein
VPKVVVIAAILQVGVNIIASTARHREPFKLDLRDGHELINDGRRVSLASETFTDNSRLPDSSQARHISRHSKNR